jgi:hypothetical protein
MSEIVLVDSHSIQHLARALRFFRSRALMLSGHSPVLTPWGRGCSQTQTPETNRQRSLDNYVSQ